jgi:hypothetical protein
VGRRLMPLGRLERNTAAHRAPLDDLRDSRCEDLIETPVLCFTVSACTVIIRFLVALFLESIGAQIEDVRFSNLDFDLTFEISERLRECVDVTMV